MASDYAGIRKENEKRYGTDIERIGRMLLSERYADRTHFIFELLQNAEDALTWRTGSCRSRAVKFHLANNKLHVSHYGKPFDENDVRAICGIALSTKGLNAIGRFGIGFKSVYAFPDRPEIHSGAEDFAIESYVWPVAAQPITERDADETVILLPLRDAADHEIIASALQQLGPRVLLFLLQIEGIEWHVEGGPYGLYLRDRSDNDHGDKGVRRISIIGEENGKCETEQTWIVFSRPVTIDQGSLAGYVEIAFMVDKERDGERETVVPVHSSSLVVFFPTVLETHLGFLVQGPYRTTPSRDNVPRSDVWNQHLVRETATLLIDALRWPRDHNLLNTAALQCLPLDPTRFSKETMFAPLFESTKKALIAEQLLPRFDGGYVQGSKARLARTQELRELFAPGQLATLFGHEGELVWLSSDITQDRTPELRQYLLRELQIAEVTPETIITRLDKGFLEEQSDPWITRLYEFLGGQPVLLRRLNDLPLIRLEDGTHVAPKANDRPQAFLPGKSMTGLPTVRSTVCATEAARKFLESLGLTEPDPVDDVIWNVLPKYSADTVDISNVDYEDDIRRILTASATDSKSQRDKLLAGLSKTAFVMAVDAGHGTRQRSKPGKVYLATERLKGLFYGVPNVLLIDDSYPCLRREGVRELLEACGAVRYLRPVPNTSLSWQERCTLRVQAGCPQPPWRNEHIKDWTLDGLGQLLNTLPQLEADQRRKRAELLWEELAHLEERRGKGVFEGEYTCTRSKEHYHALFDASFVRCLRDTAWVPGPDGQLERPEFVVFEPLGWKPSPFLQSKIPFKPPIIDQLAKEVGIEPGALELLRKLGVTTEAELRSKLGLPETEPIQLDSGPQNVDETLDALLGNETAAPAPPVPYACSSEPQKPGGPPSERSGSGTHHATGAGVGRGAATSPGADGRCGGPSWALDGGAKRMAGSPGGRPFIPYVGAHPRDEEPDPDGLDHAARMALEEKAIDFILQSEPRLQRTLTHNPGFDLFEPGAGGQPVCWVEVKAMTGSLHDRPVGLSHAQFDCAREHDSAYWLYVVEYADEDGARVKRIRDPAGRTRTFTFDHGWLAVAE